MKLLPSKLEGKRMLDVGFGCGTVTHKIVSESGKPWSHFTGMPYVIGIDKDPSSVEFAKRWMPFYKDVYLQDVTDIPYPRNITDNLDIVICTEVVEHTTDKRATLAMIKYLSDLAPLVIFTCPNGDDTNKKFDQEWHNHNSIWYQDDFRKLSFKTKLETKYTREVEFVLRIASKVFTGKPLYRTIVAWHNKNDSGCA
jgi:SAM-dependent methyltransferase